MSRSRANHQLSLPPTEVIPVDRREHAKSTAVDHPEPSRSTAVDQATALLRRAVADCGYTLDALEAAMGKDRAYINKVLNGEKPVSLAFIIALPDDVEARFEHLRAEQLGLIVVKPAAGADAVRQLVSGLVGVLAGKAIA